MADRIRHPEWPNNYIRHILEKQGEVDVVLVSTHKEVRDAMVEAEIPFVLIYPGLEMEQEYIERYVARGNAPAFVELLRKHYKEWITELEKQVHCTHVVLRSGQYLVDVLPSLESIS